MPDTERLMISVPLDEVFLKDAVARAVRAMAEPQGYGRTSLLTDLAQAQVRERMKSPDIASLTAELVSKEISAQIGQTVNHEVGKALRAFVKGRCGDLIASALGSGLLDALVREAVLKVAPIPQGGTGGGEPGGQA